MAAIEAWLRQPAAQAVGWALLQSVWQGTLVGLIAALALLALGRRAADVRYLVSSIALGLLLTLPVVTGVQKYQTIVAGVDASPHDGLLRPEDRESGFRGKGSRPTAPSTPAPTQASTQASVRALVFDRVRAAALPPALLVVWLAGVSILTLRLLAGWVWAQRLRSRGVSAASEASHGMAARLTRQLRIPRVVTLLESSLVEVPTVIGFLRPVILLPASALAGLAPAQLEAVLAHELAHVRRHDYLVNLLQTLVETLLFYHPAVWWLSRRIRVERENCCDDLAVAQCGDPVAYAAALADLEALRSTGPAIGRVAMAATGGSLLHRVRRLLGAPSPHAGRGPAWLAGTAALLLVGGIAAGADGARPRRLPLPTVAGAPDAGIAAAATADQPSKPAPGTSAASPPAAKPTAAPSSAAPAAPAAGAAQTTTVTREVSSGHGNWIWSNDNDRLDVSYAGRFEFTDDDADVREMSAGGWLKISDGRWFGRHAVEIRERNGAMDRRYYVNALERSFEPEGRAWLREHLPRFVRNAAIGADSRVARLLKSGGPSAVLVHIGRIESVYAKGVYFKELLRQATLTPEQYRQAMAQASREMRSSSYELAQLLTAAAPALPTDDAARAAYFEAASAVTSDYERRRVLSTMLARGPVPPSTLAGILASAKSIASNYELGELLRQILARQPIDEGNRAAFFAATGTLASAYERHRVLTAVVSPQRASDPALLEAALASAGGLRNDYETATFLLEVLKQNGVEGRVRAPFFAAANAIGSGYEHGRVLQAVARRDDVSADTLRAVLQSARTLNGYELSQLLQAVARTHTIGGELRDAYLEAADRLSGYEQGQVMTALVRSERRK